MPKSRISRIGMSRLVLRALLGAAPLGLLCVSDDASAQSAGTNARPLPNVLLLVDNSGSMERMPDSSLPSLNQGSPTPPNTCVPGSPSNPNRWGMLVQALTGNMQPYYSCDAIPRTDVRFKNEFAIGTSQVYDADYFLPYHRPLTGALTTACAFAPNALPGTTTGSGVGPARLGVASTVASDFPPNAFQSVFNSHLVTQYSAAAPGLAVSGNTCTFEQTGDGQLDAARDYVRFAMMTFDNDTDPGVGVATAVPPGGLVSANPFVGQWSYVISSSWNPFGVSPAGGPSGGTTIGFGMPGGCTTGAYAQEVGARHAAAPPWEGRMVRFPTPNADLFDIARTNDEIQKVLIGTRPYGATPIAGMLEDARDYLWFNPTGPLSSTASVRDPYVEQGCREQFIILLTDGAPNLDLRTACETGSAPTAGQCPFNKSAKIAEVLATGVSGKPAVKTYVIGFSVNGAGDTTFVNDGFPTAPHFDCKSWYNSFGVTTMARTNGMRLACTPATAMSTTSFAGTPVPGKGSTADACCQLNEIAYWGTPAHDVGPFFAQSQADIVLSFGNILGGVSKVASTRTLPGYAPPVTISGVGNSAEYIASFIPDARRVWSGEIDRKRSVCGAGGIPAGVAASSAQGDSYANALATQAGSPSPGRLFLSVQATATTRVPAAIAPQSATIIDSARSIRPFASSPPTDGIAAFSGTEVFGIGQALAATSGWPRALDIHDLPASSPPLSGSCRRSKAPAPTLSGTVDVPPLDAQACTDITWGFATAATGVLNRSGYDFNVRCKTTGGNNLDGLCSNSGSTCSLEAPSCPTPGEVCVPKCAALGAIYHSSPALIGPPNQFLRDDSYLRFQAARASRRPAMFVATADGILHAFKALATNTFDPGNVELWAFIPPAVLPKLASNYPTGQQILLDGSPVVRDVVWERRPADPVDVNAYHTTLVAGMGAGGPGYYALNVSDVDCGGSATPGCNASYAAATAGVTNPRAQSASTTIGPHFLWQLTDIPAIASDPAKPTRTAKDGTAMVALFGKESGTPAITTLQVDPGDGFGARQIGVAILPGGIDGPPVKGSGCLRAIDGGAPGFVAANFDFSDGINPAGLGLNRRNTVRQWGATCAPTTPVPGRGVTIVRLDTGEILRHFGRQGDTPLSIQNATPAVFTPSPFDSPVIGTPAVYPNIIGATAQKAFVGDADGTVWRLDLSSPTPGNWRVTLFQDLVSRNLPLTPGFAESQPIAVPPVLSLDPTGNIVLNVATGDQENLTATPTGGVENNYVYSLQEQRPTTAGTPGYTKVQWYLPLPLAERVTGPMTVFDRSLYFASFQPLIPSSAACSNGGNALLWGMDFFQPGGGVTNAGGVPRWCPIGRVDPQTGACLEALILNENPAAPINLPPDPALAGAIIPGVTIRAQQSCAEFASPTGGLSGVTSTKFDLNFGATTNRTSGTTGTPQAARAAIARPLPRTTAVVDAWALVVD
jgi:type IV pilus assembly protein PilY1